MDPTGDIIQRPGPIDVSISNSFNLEDASELEAKYSKSLEILADWMSRGIAAAVYTQTSDVECEVNGLLSYDRKIQKLNATFLAKVHDKFWRTEAAQRTSDRGSGGYLPASCKKACDKQGGVGEATMVFVVLIFVYVCGNKSHLSNEKPLLFRLSRGL